VRCKEREGDPGFELKRGSGFSFYFCRLKCWFLCNKIYLQLIWADFLTVCDLLFRIFNALVVLQTRIEWSERPFNFAVRTSESWFREKSSIKVMQTSFTIGLRWLPQCLLAFSSRYSMNSSSYKPRLNGTMAFSIVNWMLEHFTVYPFLSMNRNRTGTPFLTLGNLTQSDKNPSASCSPQSHGLNQTPSPTNQNGISRWFLTIESDQICIKKVDSFQSLSQDGDRIWKIFIVLQSDTMEIGDQ
jgi:hypothetical protein